MYKDYQSERAFYNAKIHGLAHLLYGEDAGSCLKSAVRQIIETDGGDVMSGVDPVSSVTALTDTQAKELYYYFLNSYKKLKASQPKGIEMMTDDQRRKIIKITKYKFRWPLEVTFSKILEFVPELSKRLTPWQIKQTKILPLFNQIKRLQADQIIKRLEKIEKKSKEQIEK